ncbi:kinase-like domain-containing protein [Amylostereum chailletii]|nr:kinase-like domain-containing protein [Amylostereum chailletii]
MNDDLKAISDSRTCLVNFEELRDAVENCMQEDCISVEWVAEGGANQIYSIRLPSGRDILARLSFCYPYGTNLGVPFKHQEEYDRERLSTRALVEIATIRFIKDNTNVPVAEIYGYDVSAYNPVGTTYTLQECIQGDVMSERWFTMTLEQQSRAITSFATHLGQILSLSFNSFGSLVHRGTETVVDCQPPPLETLSRYYPATESGPWPADRPLAFIEAQAIREYLWLSSSSGCQLFASWRSKMYPSEDQSKSLPAFIEFSYRLIHLVRNACISYPLPDQLHKPTLMHGDLHLSNVLVSEDDPGVISGIVDWDFSRIVPLWAAYDVPGMITDSPLLSEERRSDNTKLRHVFWETLAAACPDLEPVVHPQDNVVAWNSQCLRILKYLATEGVALFSSCAEVKAELSSLQEYSRVTGPDAQWAIDYISEMISLFP